jgi:hypothetical protein
MRTPSARRSRYAGWAEGVHTAVAVRTASLRIGAGGGGAGGCGACVAALAPDGATPPSGARPRELKPFPHSFCPGGTKSPLSRGRLLWDLGSRRGSVARSTLHRGAHRAEKPGCWCQQRQQPKPPRARRPHPRVDGPTDGPTDGPADRPAGPRATRGGIQVTLIITTSDASYTYYYYLQYKLHLLLLLNYF